MNFYTNVFVSYEGFGQRTQQGYLDPSAHRMMNHYTNNYNSDNGGNRYQQRGQDRGGAYSSVAPPSYPSRKYFFHIFFMFRVKSPLFANNYLEIL